MISEEKNEDEIGEQSEYGKNKNVVSGRSCGSEG